MCVLFLSHVMYCLKCCEVLGRVIDIEGSMNFVSCNLCVSVCVRVCVCVVCVCTCVCVS